MKDPNNILAIEYLKEMRLLGCDIEPVTVRRHAAGLDEADARARIAGATAIREMFRLQHPGAGDEADGQQRTNAGHEADEQQHPGAGDGAGSPWAYIPAAATPFISGDVEGWGGSLVFDDALFPYLVHTVIAAEQGALSRIFSATEGLENRLISAVHRAHNIHEAVRYTKTRRYTETRVRRLILHTIMGLTKELMSEALEEPPYARILAFSETGAKLIRRVKKSGNIPVISNANREKTLLSSSPVTFGFDVRTAEIYRLLQTGNIAGFNECTAR
jgi:predicted nucleotidyltransferase